MTNGYACEDCGFKLWLPVADLAVASLGLYDDERFPGRCILVLRGHKTSFEELEEGLASALISDARSAARAIRTATKAPRVNYALLGNVEPHVHVHLIPRGHPDDPVPGRSPWAHPDPARPMDADRARVLMDDIRSALPGQTAGGA